MARDIVGLLTGISGTQQPMQPQQPVAGTAGFRGMFGAQQAQGLAGGLGSIARQGAPSNQERMQEAVSKLDLGSVDGLTTLAKLQQIQGDLPGAAQTAAKIKQLQEQEQEKTAENKLRNSLIKMSSSQNNSTIKTWLEAGGDIQTAASVLLKQPKLATAEAFATMYDDSGKPIRTSIIDGKLHKATENGWAVVKDNETISASMPSKEERTPKVSLPPKEREKTYNAIISTNPDIAKVFTDEGYFWDDIDKDAKTLLLNKAEEIYAKNPDLGREGALLQAANVASTTTKQSVPETDPYAGKTVK